MHVVGYFKSSGIGVIRNGEKIVIVLTALDLYTLINFPDICYLVYLVSVSVVTDVLYAVLNELAQNIIL